MASFLNQTAASNLNDKIYDLQSSIQNLQNRINYLSTLQDSSGIALSLAHLWRINATIFVFFMQVGFSLLEAGTVRFKNTRNIMIKNVLDTCVCAIAFWLFGYALGFGEGNEIFGYSDSGDNLLFAFPGKVDTVDWFFQFAFAATSTTIIAGAIAERTQLSAYLAYNFAASALIYPVVAHIIWSKNGFLSAGSVTRNHSVLGTDGVLDNAGSMVVHVTGGMTSLVGSWIVGPRIGRYDIDGNPVPFKSHSMVFAAAGTIILWIGFYGFNGGSLHMYNDPSVEWSNQVGLICLNTTLSCTVSGLTVFLLTIRSKEPSLEDTFNGVIGGLVAACATSGVVRPYAAFITGAVAGVFYLAGKEFMIYFQIDDVVMATPTHLACGSWGAISAGLFAKKELIRVTYDIPNPRVEGLVYTGNFQLLLVQCIGLLIVYVWVGLSSFILFSFLSYFRKLRVKRKVEEIGLDVAFHGGEDTDVESDSDGSETNKRKVYKGMSIKNLSKNFCSEQSFFGQSGKNKFEKSWNGSLIQTPFGQISMSMYEGNYVMEDRGEIEFSSDGVYLGVHDGHGGTEVSEFLKEHLYQIIKDEITENDGVVDDEVMKQSYEKLENLYVQVARESFSSFPHLATVGSCSVTMVVTADSITVANVGDCRAVLGQVRQVEGGKQCRALQLSYDHNLKNPAERESIVSEHPNVHDIVQEKNGNFKVKGKLSVTRAIGDLYLKSHEFNSEPLYKRFRVPEPFHPPLISSEPNVQTWTFEPYDRFVVLASDGLFDFLTNQEVVDLVATKPKQHIARVLVREALNKAAKKSEMDIQELMRLPMGQRREHHDDITVIVFFFENNEYSSPSTSSSTFSSFSKNKKRSTRWKRLKEPLIENEQENNSVRTKLESIVEVE